MIDFLMMINDEGGVSCEGCVLSACLVDHLSRSFEGVWGAFWIFVFVQRCFFGLLFSRFHGWVVGSCFFFVTVGG